MLSTDSIAEVVEVCRDRGGCILHRSHRLAELVIGLLVEVVWLLQVVGCWADDCQFGLKTEASVYRHTCNNSSACIHVMLLMVSAALIEFLE